MRHISTPMSYARVQVSNFAKMCSRPWQLIITRGTRYKKREIAKLLTIMRDSGDVRMVARCPRINLAASDKPRE